MEKKLNCTTSAEIQLQTKKCNRWGEFCRPRKIAHKFLNLPFTGVRTAKLSAKCREGTHSYRTVAILLWVMVKGSQTPNGNWVPSFFTVKDEDQSPWVKLTCGTPPTRSLQNGDFEEPVISFASHQLNEGEAIGSWKVTKGSVDLVHDDHWQPAHGAQSLDLNGCSPGRASQQIDITPGRQYTIRFSYSGNPDAERGIKRFHLELNGANIGDFSFDTSDRSSNDMNWQTGEVGFVSSSSSAEIAFTSDTLDSACYGPVIENVTVAPLTF